MIQLIDDQWLGRVLLGADPPIAEADVFTTGYWYVRLCQAVLGASERSGVLSSPFSGLPPRLRSAALEGLLSLPDTIGLLSLRELAPSIGRLRERYDLNILGMEALAAATRLEANVFLSAPSPRLVTALETEGRPVTVRA